MYERLRVELVGAKYLAVEPSPDPQGDSLKRTKLPVIELTIPQKSQTVLLDALPKVDPNAKKHFFMFAGVSAPKWPYVPATLTYKGKKYNVDIRYRGWFADHHLLEKKSWRVRFPRENLLYGVRQINIVNQRDHTVVSNILTSELLRESGFLVATQFPVHLRINGQFAGIQTYLEQPKRRFCVKHNRVVADIYGEKKVLWTKAEFLDPNNWQKLSAYKDKNSFDNLIHLHKAIFMKGRSGYREAIEDILDVDQYLTYCAHAAITLMWNPSTHNIRWFYDPAIGRFQIFPWYQAGLYEFMYTKNWNWDAPYATAVNDVFDGLFQVPEYRTKYYQKTWKLLNTTHEVSRILAKINELYDLVKEDVYADSHIHFDYRLTHYISNVEWEKSIQMLKQLFVKRDKFLRSELAGCNLNVAASDAKHSGKEYLPREEDLTILGSIYLESSGRIDPYVESLTVEIDGPEGAAVKELMLLEPLPSASVKRFRPIGISGGNPAEVTFQIERAFTIDVRRERRNKLRGIFVADPPPRSKPSEVAYIPVPTTHRLFLAVEKDSGREIKSIDWRICRVEASNSITGEQIKVQIGDPDHVEEKPCAKNDLSPESEVTEGRSYAVPLTHHPRTPEGTLKEIKPDGIHLLPAPTGVPQKIITWEKGTIRIDKDFVVERGAKLLIGPGTTIKFGEGKSLWVKGQIEAHGTENEPITFTWATPGKHWGTVAVCTHHRGINSFRHCIFEHGANATLGRVDYTGTLSLYLAEGSVENCIFRDNIADDALNSCYVSPTIRKCRFERNGDAVDIDFGGGLVEGCIFVDSRGDSIDLSSSWAKIANNVIRNSGDKGVSIGEKSRPLLYNNLIVGCGMGVAIKDLSEAVVLNNTITRNTTGVALYKKKAEFGPGKGRLVNCIVFGNDLDIYVEDGSGLLAEHCCLGQVVSGRGNVLTRPGFRDPENGDFALSPNSPCWGAGNGRLLSDYGLKGSTKLTDMGYLSHE